MLKKYNTEEELQQDGFNRPAAGALLFTMAFMSSDLLESLGLQPSNYPEAEPGYMKVQIIKVIDAKGYRKTKTSALHPEGTTWYMPPR